MNTDFEKMITEEKSPVFEGLFSSFDAPAPTSIRLNRLKEGGQCEVATESDGNVAWNPDGLYLSRRPAFTLMPELHQGRFYVQEASSMFVAHIVRQIVASTGGRPLRVLDACAAPGGKTTAVLSALPEGSAVIANEFDFRRAEILRENLAKWGDPSVAVVRGDTAQFRRLRGCFDLIVADVPCSGEGMFRKSEEARRQWSRQLVEDCADLQREIVDNVIGALAPGGFLVYSTCTFNTTENERNVEYICREHGLSTVAVEKTEDWNIAGAVNSAVHASRFLPHRLRGEGLFAALLRKPGELPEVRSDNVKPAKDKTAFGVENLTDGLVVEKVDDRLWGATPALRALIDSIRKKGLSFLTYGIELAEIKGRDLVLSAPLALSTALRRDKCAVIEVDKEQALAYLRKDTVLLPDGAPVGFVLLMYQGYPLGWVKNLGRRANNLWPKEWRIRS